ncbi:hypothetical protein [Hymenobacter sp. UYP22]|uniref:hypothetical protein n=1 Tax=Hymenobacter sp. UYP22 TaxID=3156348 RepID=UPI00339B63CC
MAKSEVCIVDKEGKELLRFCYIDGQTKREYLLYIKQQIIAVVLALATDYSTFSHDEIFDCLECVAENEYLFYIEVFEYLDSQIKFFDQKEWTTLICLVQRFINLLAPGWWQEIRSKHQSDWYELQQDATQLLSSFGIDYQNPIEYTEQHMQFDVMRITC